jgi:hypothetical protein
MRSSKGNNLFSTISNSRHRIEQRTDTISTSKLHLLPDVDHLDLKVSIDQKCLRRHVILGPFFEDCSSLSASTPYLLLHPFLNLSQVVFGTEIKETHIEIKLH